MHDEHMHDEHMHDEHIQRSRAPAHLVQDAVDAAVLHALLQALRRPRHRLRDLLGGTGGKAEDVVCRNMGGRTVV